MPKFFAGRRGEYADQPFEIPWRGWWQVMKRVQGEVVKDRLSIISAGISFYCLLSVFPAIAMFIMLYGLVSDAETVRQQVSTFSGMLPDQAYAVLLTQLERVESTPSGSLGFGLLLSFALTAWGASRAVQALMIAMNVAYEEQESRGIIEKNLVAFALTIGGLCFFAVSIAAIAALPAAIAFLDVGGALAVGLVLLQWTVLCIAAVLALTVVYRFAPCRASARFRWLTPGAIVATLLWLVSSLLFSFYVANFANYNETFGSIGAVVVLLLWFYISAFAVCIGAEINAELERQTYRDTTTGPIRPIGRRGAYVADTTAGPND
ncbi:MAG: YihY/virulence factor BrkB family protein [Kiloniellaceae bacterium]